MGGRTQTALRLLLRATQWLHRDGYAALAGRLRGLQLDMGQGFESSLELGADEVSRRVGGGWVNALGAGRSGSLQLGSRSVHPHPLLQSVLIISRCFYADLFAAEVRCVQQWCVDGEAGAAQMLCHC